MGDGRAYRFVQLSDIHFGQERNGTLVTHDDVRSQLVADVATLTGIRGPADMVLIVGDVAYSGKDDQYKTAASWLDQLTAAAKCDETSVRVVPGNHDCDRTHVRIVAKTLHDRIRGDTTKSAYAVLDEMAKGPDEENPLLPKLKAYRVFAASYASDFVSIGRPAWTTDFELSDGIYLRLVGMTSVQVCDQDDSSARMILGSTQYVLPEEPHIIYAVMVHHPLDWYMDKADAKPYLRKRVRLMMVGHEHVADINKVQDVQNNEWLDIYSGATNPPHTVAPYQYAYNWLEVHLTNHGGLHHLVVNVFPRVWVPEHTRFGPDLQRLGGRESAEFHIACPGAMAPHYGSPLLSTATSYHDPAEAAEGAIDVPSTNSRTNAMSDDAAVAKLKFLFWRYLDWKQRLTVLVQADALPTTAERPVPHTMEQMALDTARQAGKLAAVWDAMMMYVPSNKKQANPFRGGAN